MSALQSFRPRLNPSIPMPLAAALALLLSLQTPPPNQAPVADIPKGPPATPAEVGAWKGWKYTPAAPARPAPAFAGELPQAPAILPDAVVFKLRVFVLTRVESAKGADGRPEAALTSIDRVGEARALAAVGNLAGVVAAASGGKVRLQTVVTTDAEPITLNEGEGRGRGFARGVRAAPHQRRALRRRGRRGPGAVLGRPRPRPARVRPPAHRRGNPGYAAGFYARGGQVAGTSLEAGLAESAVTLMALRAREHGVPIAAQPRTGLPTSGLGASPALAPGLGVAPGDYAPFEYPTFGADGVAAALPPSALYLEDGGERGTVLRYREGGAVRRGGFALPEIPSVPGKPNLAFWVRRLGADPVQISSGNTETNLGTLGVAGVAVPADGTWTRVVVPVEPGPVTIGPSEGLRDSFRRDLTSVNVWFSDFELTGDPVTPVAPCPDTAPSESSADGRVLRLAAMPLASDGETEAIGLLNDINPLVAKAAATALGAAKTPAANAALRNALRVGPTEGVRQEAARQLAKTGDPALVLPIAELLGRQSWESRLAAVEALGLYRQENAVRFRLSATLQENPAIRYAALAPATLDNPDERQKLLYAAINDPADTIRALACDRLLDAKDPAVVAEGLRGTADDSPWVRKLMQDNLARRKDPAFRDAILRGLADPVPAVRVAAFGALASLGPVAPADVAGLLKDPSPEVLLALRAAAKAGTVALPESTRALIAASPDPRLKSGAGQ